MKNKSYAVTALKDILARALHATYWRGVAVGWTEDGAKKALLGEEVDVTLFLDDQPQLRGWDLEFARMSREEQVDWLLQLFEVLVKHG